MIFKKNGMRKDSTNQTQLNQLKQFFKTVINERMTNKDT